jgi:hypothetical protein
MKARMVDKIMEWRESDNKKIAAERQAERLREYLEKIPKRFRGKSFADYCVDYPQQSRIKSLLRNLY